MPIEKAMSVRQYARKLAVGPAKIREWIRKGNLQAMDLGLGGRNTTIRITAEAARAFEESRIVRPIVARPRRRRELLDPEIEAILSGCK